MTRKLDKEHLDEIQALRDAFSANSQTLGNLYIEEFSLQQQLQQLTEQRTKFMKQFVDLRKQEEELLEKMRNRYGDGQINIAQGTFTPTA
jgi:predicted transcriptional regulator